MLILTQASSSIPDTHPFRLSRSAGTASATVTLDTTAAKLIFLAGNTANATSEWSDNRGNTFVQEPVISSLCAAYCLNPVSTGAGHAFTMSNAGSSPTVVASAWVYPSGTPTVDQPFVPSPVSASPVILPSFTTGVSEALILVGWAGVIYVGYPTFDSGFEIVWATGWSGAVFPVGIAFLRPTAIATVNLQITHTGGTNIGAAAMVSFK